MRQEGVGPVRINSYAARVVLLLKKAGANAQSADKQATAPLDWARIKGHSKVETAISPFWLRPSRNLTWLMGKSVPVICDIRSCTALIVSIELVID